MKFTVYVESDRSSRLSLHSLILIAGMAGHTLAERAPVFREATFAVVQVTGRCM